MHIVLLSENLLRDIPDKNTPSVDEVESDIFRNYGSDRRYYNKVVGANSRLDEMQAGLLRVRLQHINELNKEKEQIARCYLEGITNEKIILPGIRKDCGHVWHQFVVRCSEQERFMKYLDDHGIGTLIHYPIPPLITLITCAISSSVIP